MMLRRAALAFGSLALVGTLAACDLPGGTPPTISVDVEPNDVQEDAREIFVPQVVRGTFGPTGSGDTQDWYLLKPPAVQSSLTVSCPAGPYRFSITIGQTSSSRSCDEGAQTLELPSILPEDDVYLNVYQAMVDVPVVTYAVNVRYGAVGDL